MTAAGAEPARPEPAVPDPAHDVFRASLRMMGWLLVSLSVLGLGAGYAFARGPGVWAALMGVAVAALFSGTTIVSMLRTTRSSPTTMAAVVLGAWLGKILVLMVVLATISDRDFYNRVVFGAVLFAGVVGSALLDYRAVVGGRVPYVTPANDGVRSD